MVMGTVTSQGYSPWLVTFQIVTRHDAAYYGVGMPPVGAFGLPVVVV